MKAILTITIGFLGCLANAQEPSLRVNNSQPASERMAVSISSDTLSNSSLRINHLSTQRDSVRVNVNRLDTKNNMHGLGKSDGSRRRTAGQLKPQK